MLRHEKGLTQLSQISDGDGTDALVYNGSLKAVSEIEEGYVTEVDITSKTVTYAKGDYMGE